MAIKHIIVVTLLLFSFTSFSYSQDHNHDHEHEHIHSKNEFGFSNNIVFNSHENEFAYGVHLHFVRTIGKSDKFGLGLGYERIFDEHGHNSVNLLVMYRPIHHLSVNLAPGVVWSDKDAHINPSLHLEAIYEWEFGHFHIGPLVGVAINSEHFHASIGLHLAVGF